MNILVSATPFDSDNDWIIGGWQWGCDDDDIEQCLLTKMPVVTWECEENEMIK